MRKGNVTAAPRDVGERPEGGCREVSCVGGNREKIKCFPVRLRKKKRVISYMEECVRKERLKNVFYG